MNEGSASTCTSTSLAGICRAIRIKRGERKESEESVKECERRQRAAVTWGRGVERGICCGGGSGSTAGTAQRAQRAQRSTPHRLVGDVRAVADNHVAEAGLLRFEGLQGAGRGAAGRVRRRHAASQPRAAVLRLHSAAFN